MSEHAGLPRAGLINLALVYVAWGSTYLAIRIGVRPGSGFPPFSLAFWRLAAAGVLLFGIARLRRKQLRISRQELAVLAVTGVLLWVGGNGLVVWAEQTADSGLAALILATLPLWSAVFESVWRRKLPSPLLIVSLLVGLAGVAVLSLTSFEPGSADGGLAVLVLLAASMLWSLGALIQSRRSKLESGQVRSAYQHVFGAVGLLLLARLAGEPTPTPTPAALAAWGYLVVFGSLVGFTAFTTMINQLPFNVAMTYAYVNPLIAIVLGALILSEPVTGRTLAGGILILLGVGGVFQDRRRRATAPTPET